MAKENKIEVLLEEIRSDVKLALEGHSVIRNEMRQMEERLTDKISLVDGKVEFMGAELRGVKVKVDRIDRTLEQHVKLPAHIGV